MYESIIPVCIQFILDPECKFIDSRRITSSSRKPVVSTLIQCPRSIKIGLLAIGSLFIAIHLLKVTFATKLLFVIK